MPLAVTGTEGVWYDTLLELGFTDIEARSFLVGPAFLAWQLMTNIEGHGGPLPKSWIDGHVALGQKIIARELEFGMKPIQQADQHRNQHQNHRAARDNADEIAETG